MTSCHCGRPGLYAGRCFYHAEGFAERRSKVAKATFRAIRRSEGRHPLDPVKLCRKGLHRMTKENTVTDSRGRRCKACRQLAKQRSIDGLATPNIRTAVLHHTPKWSPVTPHRYTDRERVALTEAREQYRAWLEGKSMLDLAERAVA